MKYLKVLNTFFWKYRWRFLFGILFILLSNYFRILAPQVTGFVMDTVQLAIHQVKHPETFTKLQHEMEIKEHRFDPLVKAITAQIGAHHFDLSKKVLICGLTLLILALLGGFFMFLMRQTIIVMSRLIEYDQKNMIYKHYQQLDLMFYKMHRTGDLMNRISEDVSRVRMYTGPALMYFINLAATISLCIYFMMKTQAVLTLYVLAPLPILAFTIYKVNMKIHKKSENIQGLLSDLTTQAQETYSGIRVIKSFVQEKAMNAFFFKSSEGYRENAIDLSKMESMYFPSMAFLIGLSTLLTIMMGGVYAIQGNEGITVGTITEFVMYVNMLTFPVSAIGWTASMIQRAAASQKRINEFMEMVPAVQSPEDAKDISLEGNIIFENVNYQYPNTGIQALKNFNLQLKKGEKVVIVGHTGSGKTTLAQLLLRFMDPDTGNILLDGKTLKSLSVQDIRGQMSYVPQDVFLFSDTVKNNIAFGLIEEVTDELVVNAARSASIDAEIQSFENGYETMIGERGVTLSGGQKQRISIARGLIKNPQIVILDDCLSAVDAKTEQTILQQLHTYLSNKTAIVITHRIFSLIAFDRIIVMENGSIIEEGTHDFLISQNGTYKALYDQQMKEMHQEIV